MQSEHKMVSLDNIFRAIRPSLGTTCLIACLYTGTRKPASCAPMLRSPLPGLGAPLDRLFGSAVAAACVLNSAIHDGATLFERGPDGMYRVSGWSYRLFPPENGLTPVENRGSAFNSCLAMSVVKGVDRLYLVRPGTLCRFENGSLTEL
jgi:hypothetical protein